MNSENANAPAWTSAVNVAEQTVAQLKEENERLTQALYNLQKDKEQLRSGLFNLLEPSLDQWLKDSADDFLETHFDIANHIDDIADALPEREFDFDSYQDEIRDVVQDIVKYAEVKITV
jgi:chromosome segregation ATPase